MANITRRTDFPPSGVSVVGNSRFTVPDLLAGENLAAGDAVYLKADGRYWKASVTDANTSRFVGIAVRKQFAGQPVTALRNTLIAYTLASGSTKIVPGKGVYLSATAGALADAPVNSTDKEIGVALDDGVILFY